MSAGLGCSRFEKSLLGYCALCVVYTQTIKAMAKELCGATSEQLSP
jgi:hypothetical protein